MKHETFKEMVPINTSMWLCSTKDPI